MSLRSRLFAVAATIVIVMLVAGVAVARSVRSSLITQLDQRLDAAVPAVLGIAAASDPSNPFGGGLGGPGNNQGGGQGNNQGRGPAPSGNALSELYLGFLSSAGKLTSVTPSRLAPRGTPAVTVAQARSAAPAGPAAGRPRPAHAFEVASHGGNGDGFRVIAVPRSGGYLIVALSMSSVVSTYQRMLIAVGVAAAAIIAVLALAGLWVVRLGLRPIRAVTEAADAITAGDHAHRVDHPNPRTEAGRLGRAFNVMLDERQQAETQLRRFVSDASHELRTPLTSILGFTGLYRTGGLTDQPTLDDAMRRIGQEGRRMTTLVDDLLLLARLDEGRPLDHRPVDLAPLLHDAALDAGATQPERTITVDAPDELVLDGDEARLRQVLANLVGNALVHTPTDVAITLRGEQRADVVVLEVHDDGPGMTEDVAAHVFDRLYRGDVSRSRVRGGSGLGLAIVRSIVEAHDGRVALVTAPGEGATFRVVVPLTHRVPI